MIKCTRLNYANKIPLIWLILFCPSKTLVSLWPWISYLTSCASVFMWKMGITLALIDLLWGLKSFKLSTWTRTWGTGFEYLLLPIYDVRKCDLCSNRLATGFWESWWTFNFLCSILPPLNILTHLSLRFAYPQRKTTWSWRSSI